MNAQCSHNEDVAVLGNPWEVLCKHISSAFGNITHSTSNQHIKGANASIKNIFSPVPLGSDFLNFVCLYPLNVCAEVLTAWGCTCEVNGRNRIFLGKDNTDSSSMEKNKDEGCRNMRPGSHPETPRTGFPPCLYFCHLKTLFFFFSESVLIDNNEMRQTRFRKGLLWLLFTDKEIDAERWSGLFTTPQ